MKSELISERNQRSVTVSSESKQLGVGDSALGDRWLLGGGGSGQLPGRGIAFTGKNDTI